MDILKEVSQKEGQKAADPEQIKLTQTLSKLGYEGVGLEFESKKTLNLLERVFEDERTWNRNLKRVYTGLYMNYDKKYQSLTVGGTSDPAQIVNFIAENIPQR